MCTGFTAQVQHHGVKELRELRGARVVVASPGVGVGALDRIVGVARRHVARADLAQFAKGRAEVAGLGDDLSGEPSVCA